MKHKITFLILALLSMIMASCGNGSSSNSESLADKIQYYPVQEDQGKKWGLLSTDGKMLISEEYNNQPSPVVNGMYWVQMENGTYTVYEASAKPKEVLEDLIDAGYLNDGLMPIGRKSERISVIDKGGNNVFSLEPVGGKEVTTSNAYFCEGILIAQTEENLYGAYNTKGERIIDFKYKSLNNFSDGVAVAVKESGDNQIKTVVIDTKGNELDDIKIKEGYSVITPFFKGGYLAIKDKEGSFRFINKKGEEIKLPGKVKNIGEWNNKYFVFQGDDGWGVMTLNDAADIVIKAKYSSISLLPGGKFFAVDNKDHYILNKDGDKELELSDDYQAFQLVNNAKFKYIATEKNHYVLLDELGKPLNKMEFATIVTSLNKELINSNYFDVAGLVQNLMANITNKGVGNYYIGEPATDLGLEPEQYRYSSSFTNEELNFEGYKYKINFSGYTNNTIGVREYDFISSNTTYQINPESQVSRLVLIANCQQNCWEDVKAKVYEAIKSKGYKTEFEGDSQGVFSNGNIVVIVAGVSNSITVTIQESEPETLKRLVEVVKNSNIPSEVNSYGTSKGNLYQF